MKPMQPMKPMRPMEPMRPMAPPERWWPEALGEPSSSGGQDGMRYAFFADARRLVVERDGAVTTYDTGAHRIGGVAQASGAAATFTSQDGPVRLEDLARVD